MHAQNRDQSDSNNPYIQIMFNINSKKVVNNNILPDRQKDYRLDIPPQIMNDKVDKTFIFPQKKLINDNKNKPNKQNLIKNTFSTFKQQDFSSQQNMKNKKKIFKSSKNNLSGIQTQRSAKNTIYKKNTSQGFSKFNSSQECQLSSGKKLTKSKTKLRTNKDTRQKIIDLMIKDYEKGVITAENFKIAISSLIQNQSIDKKTSIKSQIKNDKSRTGIPTSYKNSLATSLRNTPKHKPSKSKSEKFYYRPPAQDMQMNEFNEQPEIVERIIDRKDFVNKIVIKGINTSLFLSNEWTQKDSPKKQGLINVNVINTSDSVKDLRKQMNRTLVYNNLSQKQSRLQVDDNLYSSKQFSKICEKQNDTKSILAHLISELRNDCRNEFIPNELNKNNNMNNNALQDEQQQQQKSIIYMKNNGVQQQYLDNNNEDEQNSFSQQGQQQDQEGQQQYNELDQFYIRQQYNDGQQNKQSRIQQLQRQYQILLKQKKSQNNSIQLNNYSQQRNYNQFSNDNSKVNNVNNVNKQNNINKINKNNTNEINNKVNKQDNNIKFKQQDDNIIKSYVSSQLQNKLRVANKILIQTKQIQLNEKRSKFITQNQISKLNHILNVIQNQLSVNYQNNTGNKNHYQNQSHNQQTKIINQKNNFNNQLKNINHFKHINNQQYINNQQVLLNIISLLQNQKYKIEQQLKIYNEFNYENQDYSNKLKSPPIGLTSSKQSSINEFIKQNKNKSNNNKNNEINKGNDIEQNQIINSFKKKLKFNKNKNVCILSQKQQQQQNQPLKPHIYYQSKSIQQKQIQQLSKKQLSRKSLSKKSSSSLISTQSNHLQKIKISQLNFDYIQIGLRKRLNDLMIQKQQQYSIITQKFINDKISAKQYQQQKQIIQKWFNIQTKQLKKTKLNLLQGYKKAKLYLQKDQSLKYSTKLTKQKSYKMIKCISQKYLTITNNQLNQQQINNQLNQYDKGYQQNIIYNKNIKNNKNNEITHNNDNKNNDNKNKNNNKNQNNKINLSNHNKYKSIQQQQNQLTQNITPIQNILSLQKQSNNYILSPLTIHQSQIQSQISPKSSSKQYHTINNSINKSYNIKNQHIHSQNYSTINHNHQHNYHSQNNQHTHSQNNEHSLQQNNENNDSNQILMTLQQCQNSQSSINSKKQHVFIYKDNQNLSQQSQQIINIKIPHSNQLDHQLTQFLKKYQNQSTNENNKDKNINKGKDKDKDKKQNKHKQNNKILTQQNNTQYIQYAIQQHLYDQLDQPQFYASNQYSYQDSQTQVIDKQLQQNQYSFKKENKPSSQQRPQLNIVINKLSQQNQDDIFSPKKPIVYQQFSQQLKLYEQTNPDHKTSLEFINMNKQFNQIYIKLKCLTDQDKDDIFEFMFLDLCLEIFLQQTKNNKIMKSIQRHLVHLRKKKKIPKGFKTGLQSNKTYITHIQNFLLSNYAQTLKRLQSPMGPSAKQMLKFMRDYEDISQTQSQIQTVNLVLPIEVYQKFELQPVNKLIVEKYYDDQEKEEARIKFLKSLKHFHHKAMFDSLNQMLDIERCYGIWGKPFPWKKALSIERHFNEEQIKQKLKKASDKVTQNCSYFCGVLVDKEDSVFGKTNVSEDYLHHIRQDRMSKMLSNDMVDNQDRWIFYDDEETQVLVSISKSITSSLLTQVLQQIKFISWK